MRTTNKFKTITMVIILVLSICFTSIPVNAKKKVKYTKTEKKLAETLAHFQSEEMIDPDSFKLKAIYKVNYKMIGDAAETYKLLGIYKNCKTILYKIKYIGKNVFSGTVTDYLYISSTYHYYDSDSIDEDEYDNYTNYAKYNVKKKFFNNVKKLTKKYYKEV